ncbi:hypothetical protein [Photorhabdus sp. CRCIA-P01]|uniref:hypothetical protein n=1 Tax=Photorhabdus sp. CRCIA-P01 TaxID=2019570 RepID=UPI000E59F32D|nr:hypothetical protein [Photorhabdus sp. CRCIA-P01]
MTKENKELFNNVCELAKTVNHDDSAINSALYKTADSIEALQERSITVEEQFTTLKSKYYALIEAGEADEYFSFSPEIGFKTYTSYIEAMTTANEEINIYKSCADADNFKDINKICCGVITQKTMMTNQNYTLQGINPDTLLKKIQSDAEDALIEKIGGLFDAATNINEKNAIGQSYCLLKYGVLPSLRDVIDVTKRDVIMSEHNKNVVTKLAYIAEKTRGPQIVREILQAIGISKKCLAGALEYDVAKIRKHCKEYWNAPLGLEADYIGLHIETIDKEIFIKDSQERFYIEVPSHLDIADAEKLLNKWISQIEQNRKE